MLIRTAQSEQDFQAVAQLMRAFIDWHYQRHASDGHIIDSYFDPAKFEDELRNLPGGFAPPRGALLVADQDSQIVGCVALRPLGGGACEMKRMFVSPELHGKGAGLLLASSIMDKARELGYERMLLDTGPAQVEAQGLYRRLGFQETKPYYDLSPELRKWLVFMEVNLTL